MKLRKNGNDTVFYDGCGCISTSQSKARNLRQANELRARTLGLPR